MAEWVAAVAASVSALLGCVQFTNNLGDNVMEIQARARERVIKRNAKDINNFGTFRKQREQILHWLTNNDNVKGIGIHGTPGTGKTTIMENLNDHDQVAKMFDIVIWLDVSKEEVEGNFSKEHLQHVIARRLNLTTENRNPDQVAQSISRELEGMKYLLLLDDVKEYLNLCEIGIPNSSNGSKIVLTTRKRLVCRSMKLNEEIKVEYLPISEAWQMFLNVIGNKDLIEDPRIFAIAYEVCKECCGLPLLITKVAPTFKLKTNASLWQGVLDNWRTWPVKHRGGFEELYEMMRYCYNDLGDERSRKCFLYGALYPEDSNINPDSLLECWEAEDLLVHSNDGRTERVKAGYDTLLHLQDVSFLEKGKRVYHVTMDKFIRKVALYILEDHHECKHLVKTNKELSDPPDEESWSEKNRISLGANELRHLPRSPNCSMLSSLFLQENKSLQIIPSEFFNCMVKLRVLDLSDTGITSLPSSLEILSKLKVLHLNNCKQLGKLPSNIERLEALEFLDIHGSGINGIPSDVKKLKCLKHLWVSFGNGDGAQGVRFNYNMISELSELEELVIDFESRQQCTNDVVEDIMKGVGKLEKFKKLKFCFSEMIVDVVEVVALETAYINVPEARALLSYIQGRSWEKVQFFIGMKNWENCLPTKKKNGEYCRHPNFVSHKKYVKYCNGVGSNTRDPILEVLAEAEGFELVGHKDIKQLSYFLTANTNKIQSFLIDSCDEMETIIDTVGSGFLPNLEELIIKNLPTLKSIWKKGLLQPGCQASKLTTLVISNCKVLVNVFPPGAIQQLREIQYLTIEKCDKVKNIIRKDDAGGDQPLLPNLKELTLLDMTNLSRICAVESLTLPSLEKLKIFECPRLRKLPFKRGNMTNLNCIEAEEKWWEALQLPKKKYKEELRILCVFRSRNENDAAL